MRRVVMVGMTALLFSCGAAGEGRVVVAAGTTLVDSGFLGRVVAAYEEDHPSVELSVVGEASARVLELGRSGGAEVLFVHAPRLEEAFVAAGEAESRHTVFVSRFLLVGPPSEVARLTGLNLVRAFVSIAESGNTFVSRADGSGTFEVETDVWSAAGIVPDGKPWYVETGQGMGITLQVADQRDGFTLTEEGAYLAASRTVDLAVVDLEDRRDNPYSVIVTKQHSQAALDFASWLVSEEGKAIIESVNLELFGQVIYRP